MTPNAEWVAKLDGASDKFRELGRKAAAYVAPQAAPAAAAGATVAGSLEPVAVPGAAGEEPLETA